MSKGKAGEDSERDTLLVHSAKACGAGKMAQQVTALATNPNNLSLNPNAHVLENIRVH